MQVQCDNCAYHRYEIGWSGCGSTVPCENFNHFIPRQDKTGQKYLVRVSELRYGEVMVWAESEDGAKTAASGAEINYFDSEIADMTAEPVRTGGGK